MKKKDTVYRLTDKIKTMEVIKNDSRKKGRNKGRREGRNRDSRGRVGGGREAMPGKNIIMES